MTFVPAIGAPGTAPVALLASYGETKPPAAAQPGEPTLKPSLLLSGTPLLLGTFPADGVISYGATLPSVAWPPVYVQAFLGAPPFATNALRIAP